MRKPRETDLVYQAIDYLRLRGWAAWRCNSGMARYAGKDGSERCVRYGLPGMADVLFIGPGGRFGAAELKMPGRRPTPLQQAFLDAVRQAGGIAVVAHSLDELILTLQEELNP